MTPNQNFDLTHWKLTLPDVTASEIKTPQLTKGYVHSEWFYSANDGAMVFFAPVTGGSTTNSDDPRCELRELIDGRNSSVNWALKGTHILSAQCKVNQVPSTKKVIIGQIHAYNANPLFKLYYYDGKLKGYVKKGPKSSGDYKYDLGKIKLNETIDYEIKVVNGLLTFTVNKKKTVFGDLLKSNKDWANWGYYFKAGAYCIDNQGKASEGARVSFYKLSTIHR